MRLELDVVATRGGIVESRHVVHAAVVDARGTLRATAGDPERLTIWRSCAKPFQVMPFVESGRVDALGWADEEIAIACGSHGGEPEHVALAGAMLARVDLEEGDLVCGPHEPLSRRGQRVLQQSGAPLSRLHNNCSGKHAAMLAFARGAGWPTLGYEACLHPVQQQALERVASWGQTTAPRVVQVVDGCGVVAFGLPLRNLAVAFARLVAAAARGEEVPRRIVGAMRAHPFLVGGTDRFDTVIAEETHGRVIAKVGAEGVHAIAVPEEGIGVALKVEDGNVRAQHPAVLRALQLLDVLPDELPPRLTAFLRAPVLNTRGATVGEVHPEQ